MRARKIVLMCLISALAASAQTVRPSQRVAGRKAAPVQRRAEAKTAAEAVKTADRRDPFLSPVREGGPTGPNCSVGKKCLSISSVVLRGIVEAPSGAIAVVENAPRGATYFLRVNDPVFNGFVVKITPDSIVFREKVVDRLGNISTRDVVKTVNAPAV